MIESYILVSHHFIKPWLWLHTFMRVIVKILEALNFPVFSRMNLFIYPWIYYAIVCIMQCDIQVFWSPINIFKIIRPERISDLKMLLRTTYHWLFSLRKHLKIIFQQNNLIYCLQVLICALHHHFPWIQLHTQQTSTLLITGDCTT